MTGTGSVLAFANMEMRPLNPDATGTIVLLVEDNRDIAEMVVQFLERKGYAVDYAGDGVTGLHLAVANHYDVIVLD